MKPSEAIGGIKNIAVNMFSLGSHMNTLNDLMRALQGKGPAGEGATDATGLHGIFGLNDEREWASRMIQLDGTLPGSAEQIGRFIEWHFTMPENDWFGTIVVWYAKNRFRTFVTKMKTTAGVDNSQEFLTWMVGVIRSKPNEVAGFEALIQNFRNGDVPHMPAPEILATLRAFAGGLPATVIHFRDEFLSSLNQVATRVQTAVTIREQRASERGWLARFILQR